jgi:SAM-dependent methyltransferase
MIRSLWKRVFKADKYCPVCDSTVEMFKPLAEFYFEQARKYGHLYSFDDSETMNYKEYECPRCHCSDRDRLYALYLEKFFNDGSVGKKLTFIDFAPAAALSNFIKKNYPNLNYRTADLMAENVDDKVDITDMKIYADDSVDFFICSHVLEHVSDGNKAMRELYRILKPGARGIAMVPIVLTISETQEDPAITSAADRIKYYGQDDHVRMYSKRGFTSDLKNAGFKVQELGGKDFGENVFKKSGVSAKSVLYIVSK